MVKHQEEDTDLTLSLSITGDLIRFSPDTWVQLLRAVTEVYLYHKSEINISTELIIPKVGLRSHLSVKETSSPKDSQSKVQFSLNGTIGEDNFAAEIDIGSDFFKMNQVQMNNKVLEYLDADKIASVILMTFEVPAPNSEYWN